jgi:hypothetical protein
VDSAAWPDGRSSDWSMIADLRGTPLAQLARQAAAGEIRVTGVVARIMESEESSSSVPALMFQSAAP